MLEDNWTPSDEIHVIYEMASGSLKAKNGLQKEEVGSRCATLFVP
jgi:hypothetical protein